MRRVALVSLIVVALAGILYEVAGWTGGWLGTQPAWWTEHQSFIHFVGFAIGIGFGLSPWGAPPMSRKPRGPRGRPEVGGRV